MRIESKGSLPFAVAVTHTHTALDLSVLFWWSSVVVGIWYLQGLTNDHTAFCLACLARLFTICADKHRQSICTVCAHAVHIFCQRHYIFFFSWWPWSFYIISIHVCIWLLLCSFLKLMKRFFTETLKPANCSIDQHFYSVFVSGNVSAASSFSPPIHPLISGNQDTSTAFLFNSHMHIDMATSHALQTLLLHHGNLHKSSKTPLTRRCTPLAGAQV